MRDCLDWILNSSTFQWIHSLFPKTKVDLFASDLPTTPLLQLETKSPSRSDRHLSPRLESSEELCQSLIESSGKSIVKDDKTRGMYCPCGSNVAISAMVPQTTGATDITTSEDRSRRTSNNKESGGGAQQREAVVNCLAHLYHEGYHYRSLDQL